MKLPRNYNKLSSKERRDTRLEYIEIQKGVCYYCLNSLEGLPSKDVLSRESNINWKLFPEGFLKHPIHLHHNHDTGLTIGAVHALCNAVLWVYHGE